MQPTIPEILPLDCIDWVAHVSLVGEARAALAGFQGILHGIPNPDVMLSPMTTSEAVLSSRIEGTQASLEDVLAYEAGEENFEENRKHDIFEIINYRRAVRAAVSELEERPLSLNLIKNIHYILLDSVRGRDKGRGDFRKIQNWIGIENCSVDDAAFVPPKPEDIEPALYNLETYIHNKELDPLVQLAVVHAQFEIIHPFIDGNGRLGRILIPLFLYSKGLLKRPVFYLSEYLELNRSLYVHRLRNIRGKKGWDDWISFFLTAMKEQALTNMSKAQQILELRKRLEDKLIKVTRSRYAIPLLDILFDRPIIQSSQIVEMPTMPSKPTTYNYLRALKEDGTLTVIRQGSGRSGEILALRELLDIVEGRERQTTLNI